MRATLLRICIALVTAMLPVAAMAQSGSALKEIGQTSVGTPVFLEVRSVSRSGSIITATVRVKLDPPIRNGTGQLRSSRTVGMFDCSKQTVATKETWYYSDDSGKKEALHRVVKIPGFGPAIKGSLADVALRHLCRKDGGK